MYQFIRNLSNTQALLRIPGNGYYVASFANVAGSGPEVLVFTATRNGDILDWSEVDGGRNYNSLTDFLDANVPANDYV